jgi:hypothetical protein
MWLTVVVRPSWQTEVSLIGVCSAIVLRWLLPTSRRSLAYCVRVGPTVLPGVIGISPEPTTVHTCVQYGRVAAYRASDTHRKVGALAIGGAGRERSGLA